MPAAAEIGCSLMPSGRDLARAGLAFLVLVVGSACGSGGDGGGGGGNPAPVTPTTPTPVTVASVVVAPATATIIVGTTQTLTAAVIGSNGVALTSETVTWSSSAAGVASVSSTGVVTGVSAGTAVIIASSGGRSGTATITVNAAAAAVATITLAPTTASLAIGATQQFTATTRDAQGNVLTGRTITWASSNAGIASVNASGLVTATAAGTVAISATSGSATAQATVTVAPASAAACSTTRPLTLGQTVSGTISSTDCRLGDGSYAQKWDLTFATSTNLLLTMTSSAVDAYLIVADATTNATVAEDDDGAGGTNAKVEKTLPAGRYTVYANTFAPATFGAYQLSATASSGACTTTRPIAVPSTTNGTLSSASCRLNDGTYADRYQVTVSARTTLQFDMTSTAVDAFIAVQTASGTRLDEDDDSGGSPNARLTIALDPGTYIVLANTYTAGQTGAYQLAVRTFSDPCSGTRTISVGATVNAALSTADCRLTNGEYSQRWTLSLSSATNVIIDMTSGVVDPYLILQNAAGTTIGEDDDGGGTTQARIQTNLAAGTYTIVTTTYYPGETGAFRLAVAALATTTTVAVAATPASSSLAPGGTVQLVANVTGTTTTGVTWSSSATGVATVTTTGLVRAVGAGSATITATSLADPSKRATSAITVTTSTSTVNLDIAGMYLVQSIQALDNRIPLVSDRAAMARVFVRGSQSGMAATTVRLRVFNGTTLLQTYTGTATPSTSINEAGTASANILISASQIRGSNSIIADVDPNNTLTESNESDNSFPVSGTAQGLNARPASDLAIRLVPIRQKNGSVGAASSNLLSMLTSMWPLGRVTSDAHATYTTNLPVVQAEDGNDAWGDLVKEMDQLRRLENSTAYYYGVIRLPYTSGVFGMAYTPGKAGVGNDFSSGEGAETLAHELGHNFSRRHVGCTGAAFSAANVDQSYPYSDGRTGIYGMDLAAGNRIYPPTFTDIMSYCDNQWVSAYTYNAVLAYRAATPQSVVASTSVIMVSGSVKATSVVVDPVFNVETTPDPNDPAGQYLVEGIGADGTVLFSQRFNTLRAEEAQARHESFVVAVKVPPATAVLLNSVTVRSVAAPNLKGTRAKSRTLASLRATSVEPLVARALAGRTHLEWDPAQFPGAIIRNRRTGEVIEMTRSGQTTLDLADDVDVMLSNGVSSLIKRVNPRTGVVSP